MRCEHRGRARSLRLRELLLLNRQSGRLIAALALDLVCELVAIEEGSSGVDRWPILLVVTRTRLLSASILLAGCAAAGCGSQQRASTTVGSFAQPARSSLSSAPHTRASADPSSPCDKPANVAECASTPPPPRLISAHLRGHTILVTLDMPRLAAKWTRSGLQVTVRSHDALCSAGQVTKFNLSPGAHTLAVSLDTVARPITTLARITALDSRIKTKIGGYGLLSALARLGPPPCQANHQIAR